MTTVPSIPRASADKALHPIHVAGIRSAQIRRQACTVLGIVAGAMVAAHLIALAALVLR